MGPQFIYLVHQFQLFKLRFPLHVIMKAAFVLFVSVMVIFSVSHMAEAGCDAPCIGLEERKSQQILRGLRQGPSRIRGRRALNLPIAVASAATHHASGCKAMCRTVTGSDNQNQLWDI